MRRRPDTASGTFADTLTTFGASALLASAASMAALGAAGCSEPKATTAPPTPQVNVARVTEKTVTVSVEAVGALDGYVNAEIRARVRGYLTAQNYRDGARVKEGETLFTIDPAEFRAASDAARANVARADSALAHNKAQFERKKALVGQGIVSQQEYDDADAAVRDAESQGAAARAALEQAQLNLSYTTMRSPVSGVAGLALVRVGNLVGQDGPTLLTTVSELDPVRVNFPLSEVDYLTAPSAITHAEGRDLAWAKKQFQALNSPSPDTTATAGGLDLVLADGSVYPRRGVVVSVNRQVDPSTGTIQLQALFPNPDGLLRPGQYARVRVKRPAGAGASLVVPERALAQIQGAYSLDVVGDDNKVVIRHVEVGPTEAGFRVVQSGVKAGERVVVDGLQKVSDGQLVKPVEAVEPAAQAQATPPRP